MPIALALLQLAASSVSPLTQAHPPALPDIEIHARATMKQVQASGDAQLTVSAGDGSFKHVKATRSKPRGSASYRDLTVTLDAQARLTSEVAAILADAVPIRAAGSVQTPPTE